MKSGYRVLLALTAVGALVALASASMSVSPVRDANVRWSANMPAVYLSNGKNLTGVHEVIGRVTGLSPINVTLNGQSQFAESASYFCLATGADFVQTLGPQVINTDGSHFQIVHAAAGPAAVTYRCIGM